MTGVGEPASSSAQLHILPAEGLPESFPQIKQHPELKAVEKGRNAIMLCSAEVRLVIGWGRVIGGVGEEGDSRQNAIG